MKTREKERRDYVIIIALILLFGFICIILASGWALRFDPSWKLAANMNSNLNPDDDFLTSRPVGFIEPLDPAILTNPVWLDVFLTPGAYFSTHTPLPLTGTSTFTPIPPASTKQPTFTATVSATSVIVFRTSTPRPPTFTFTPSGPTATRTSTKTPTITFTPTTTFTPTSTATPTSTSTPTPTNTPFPSADLQITKDDGLVSYNPGGSVNYSIVVTNNGPNDAIGAVITDLIPWQITSWDWACAAQTGGASGCDAAAGSSANFTDTVNLPVGASITYSVLGNISAASTGELSNTVDVGVSVPPTNYTDPNMANNSAIDIDASANEPDVGPPDGNWYTVPAAPGSYIVIDLGPGNINFTGSLDGGSYDLVYFERYYYVGGVPQSVQLDCVLIQTATSATGPWYDIFYWCDGAADTNTNVDTNVIGGTESDNRTFMPGQLYGIPIPPYNAPPYDSGVTIDINSPLFNAGAPNGVYRYLKIAQPPSGGGADGPGLDAIYICPAGGC